MALRIGKFVTWLRVSRRHQNDVPAIDRFVRERFAADLQQHLGPSLSRQPAIVRIRRLSIKLAIPAAGLTGDSLSEAWRQELGRALFTALAYPDAAGHVAVYRAESVAAFIAAAILALADGMADRRWEFREFEALFRKGRSQGTLALLEESPASALGVLIELERARSLERVLGSLDAALLERLLSLLQSQTEDTRVLPSGLIAAARLALRNPPRDAAGLRSRAYAIRLFVTAAMDGSHPSSARALFYGLATLHTLLGIDGGSERGCRLIDHSPALPGAVADVLQQIERVGLTQLGAVLLRKLAELLDALRSALPNAPPKVAAIPARWVASPWCGLFFLCPLLVRLNWANAWRRLPQFETGGMSPLMAGVLLSLIGSFEDAPTSLDPAVELLSGYQNAADLAQLRRVFSEYPADVRAAVLEAAEVTGDTETWAATFDALADALCTRFASLVRGFRQAGRQAIVQQFFAQPGQIRIEKSRIAVYPDPHPFQVALHISSVDTPVESVSWLGGRRVEFHLEGL